MTSAKSTVYKRRQPEKSALYKIVQVHFESWQANYQLNHNEVLPGYIQNTFRAYLKCGILAYGFARARCAGCGNEKIIAFSCRSKGLCPSCCSKYMANAAMHLSEEVLPLVPIRQYVLSLPKIIRSYVTRNAKLSGTVLRIFISEIEKQSKKNCADAPSSAKLGAVTFIQRFGSSLNNHHHYHTCVIDGVFYQDEAGEVHYVPVENLGVEDTTEIQNRVRTRVLRLFKRRGLITEELADKMARWRHSSGFSVNGDVCVDPEDRKALGRLIRYCARPAFASEQLTEQSDGRIRYELSKVSSGGQTHMILAPDEFLDKISLLIPPPRKHRHHYHGVLAPNSPMRSAVVSYANRPLPRKLVLPPEEPPAQTEEEQGSAGYRSLWAMLLAHIYEIIPLVCLQCGGEMKIIAFIKEREVIDKILTHIGEPTSAPVLTPARGPPVADYVEQTDMFDDAVEEAPEFEMNQGISW